MPPKRERVPGQIGYMDIVANTGAIRSGIIASKDDDFRPLSQRHLQNDWDQVRLGKMIFSEFFRRSGRVEVSQRHIAHPTSAIKPMQHPFQDILHLSVRAAGNDSLLFRDGNPLRLAEQVRRR